HILKDLNDIVAKTVTEVHGAIVITISLGHELEAVPPRTSRRPNMCSRICLLKGASSIKSMPLFISTPGPELLDRTLRLLCGLILALLLFLNMPRDMSYRKPVPAYIPSPPPSPAAGFRERMSFGDASGYPEDVPGSVADSFSNHPNSSLSSVHTLPRHRNELVSGALQVPRIAPPVYVRTSFFRVQTYRPPTPPKGREPTHLPKYQPRPSGMSSQNQSFSHCSSILTSSTYVDLKLATVEKSGNRSWWQKLKDWGRSIRSRARQRFRVWLP
ncbi:unnamed protein product, partial [Mycena citricolor]